MLKRLSALVLMAIMLAGCQDYVPVDDHGFVISIGVDKGAEKDFLVTLQLPSAADAEGGVGFYSISVEADSLMEAADLINASASYNMDFTHCNFIMVSNAIAVGGELERFIGASAPFKLRSTCKLFVIQGEVSVFFEQMKSDTHPSATKLQSNLLKEAGLTGFVPDVTIAQYLEGKYGSARDYALPLGAPTRSTKAQQGAEQGEDGREEEQKRPEPLPSQLRDSAGDEAYTPASLRRDGNMHIALLGAALTDRGNMVGWLCGANTQLLLIGSGDFKQGRVTIPGETPITVWLRQRHAPKVHLTLGEKPSAQIEVFLGGSVIDPGEDELNDAQLTKKVEDYIRDGLAKVFETCRGLGSDALGLGSRVLAGGAQSDADFKQIYKALDASFTVRYEADNYKTGVTE